jgi:hypothetical protein
MPGAGCRKRRADARRMEALEGPVAAMEGVESAEVGVTPVPAPTAGASLYMHLHASAAAPLSAGEPMPAEFCVGLFIGRCAELGPYGSAARAAVIDNLVIAMLHEMIPAIGAIQYLPSEAKRASTSAALVLSLAGSPWAQRKWSAMWRQLSGGGSMDIVVTADGRVRAFHGGHGGRGFFPAVSDPKHYLYTPRPHPYQSYVPPDPPSAAEAPVACPSCSVPGFRVPDLPCPGHVTVKIRGLDVRMHRRGAAAAFLRASGYADDAYTIITEFNPPVRSLRKIGLVRADAPRDASALFAQVLPPEGDPLLSRAARRWLLPGHADPVVVTVVASHARVVKGVPPPFPRLPFDTLSLRQVPIELPPQRPDVRAAIAAATAAVSAAAAAGQSAEQIKEMARCMAASISPPLAAYERAAARLEVEAAAGPAFGVAGVVAAGATPVAAAGSGVAAAAGAAAVPVATGGAGPSGAVLPVAAAALDSEMADGEEDPRDGHGGPVDSSSDEGCGRPSRDRTPRVPYWLREQLNAEGFDDSDGFDEGGLEEFF